MNMKIFRHNTIKSMPKALKKALLGLFIVLMAFSFNMVVVDEAEAQRRCRRCNVLDCLLSPPRVRLHHVQGETRMMSAMREDFHRHREWIVREFSRETYIPALMMMAEQMSNIGMYQMKVVGKFFDAKSNLETQRLFNELQNVAAKDYQPSDSFCAIGTNTRSLSHSEMVARSNQGALAQIAMRRNLAHLNTASSVVSPDGDRLARWEQFRTQFCDPRDNNWSGGTTGLVSACGSGATDPARRNLDIDFTRLIDEPRYLDLDFSYDDANDTAATMRQSTPDAQAVIALGQNLYGHKAPNAAIPLLSREATQKKYLELRSVIAKRNVAQNTYNAIVGMKSRGSGGGDSAQFLRAVVADLGMSEADINEIFGESPSYYAQLEVLGKKIFQSTDFFTDLYDKPANVKRKQAALNAIELMLDRAIYESELRNEMLMSVLLSSYLEQDRDEVYATYMLTNKR